MIELPPWKVEKHEPPGEPAPDGGDYRAFAVVDSKDQAVATVSPLGALGEMVANVIVEGANSVPVGFVLAEAAGHAAELMGLGADAMDQMAPADDDGKMQSLMREYKIALGRFIADYKGSVGNG